MKIAYIMRGVPGSGKSTLAKQLANSNGAIHSTDDFFCVDGKYFFNPEYLQEYHKRNFDAFCLSLNNGVPVVILDNTNTRRWHFERYVEAAKQAGYLVAFVILPHPAPEVATQRTLHKVPAYAIKRMIEEWEN
jgi:predicted kinase